MAEKDNENEMEVSAPSEYDSVLSAQRKKVVDFIVACVNESRLNEKVPRRPQNKLNWDYFHGNIDWSHKRDEDPKIHLHKIGIAAERIRSKFKSALMKYDQWLIVEREYYPKNPVLPDFVAKNLLTWQLHACDAKTHISDAILRGAVESRLTLKVSGKYVTQPRFVKQGDDTIREDKKVWQLDLPVLSFEGYHKDTDGLYDIEETRVPKHKLLALSSDEQTPDKPYNEDIVESLDGFPEGEAEQAERAAKGNYQDTPMLKQRKEILVHNFYGTILDDAGEIFEWKLEDGSEVKLENVFCVLANEDKLILDPQRIKRFSAKPPYISGDLLRSPDNGRKAILDAGTLINQAEDELMSLITAGAIKAAHNVTWGYESAFKDRRQASGGLRDGSHIVIDDAFPHGADPMGVLKTGSVPQEAFEMYQSLDRVFAENVISNSIDLSGNLPGKQVRSTELVQASGAISDVFSSMASDLGDEVIEPLAEECLYEIIQHIDEMDEDEVRSCFEDRQDLAEQFLKMTPKQRFEQVAGMFRFRGKDFSSIIANQAKAQAMINLLSTLNANPQTQQIVETDLSVAKLVKQIVKGLGLDMEELAPSPEEQDMIKQKQLIREQALAQAQLESQQGGGASPQGSANPSQGTQPSPEQPAVGGNPMGGI